MVLVVCLLVIITKIKENTYTVHLLLCVITNQRTNNTTTVYITAVCLCTRQTSTTVTSTHGLYMQPQTHADCTTDCNVEKILFNFYCKNDNISTF